MNFDLKRVPFSRYGSNIAFSEMQSTEKRPAGLYMRTVQGNAIRREMLSIELLVDGAVVVPDVIATPTLLTLVKGPVRADCCIAEFNLVRIRAAQGGLRLRCETGAYDYAMQAGTGWEVNIFDVRKKLRITPLQGKMEVDSPWHEMRADYIVIDLFPDESGFCECAIETYDSVWHPREYNKSFADCLDEVKMDFDDWLENTLEVPIQYSEGRELAAYVNWASVVEPSGYLTRPAMFMSKNWMTRVWSWDHCFNAMALIRKKPELAWDQMMLMIDNQDRNGAFPDSITSAERVWNYSKPPIHGWALRYMMKHSDWITPARLEEIYSPLCHFTEWWFKYRDYDGDGIPQYHHGNDSGWDNCTAFEVGPPVEGADLSAYLVVQMEVLAEVAQILGRTDEAKIWQRRADELTGKLITHSWRQDHFVAPRSGDHSVFESDTLFHFLPLVLGARLPSRISNHLIAGLKQPGRFLTSHGLATESVSSPLYQADGYWRGPIWAPATMILIDGLVACGERSFAKELARRFCDMAARFGMAENFDAVTGVGLRDQAYTWTSSVFLLLAHDYLLPG